MVGFNPALSLALELRRQRQAARALVDGVVRADDDSLGQLFRHAEAWGAIPAAIRALGRLTGLSAEAQDTFLAWWLRHGDHFRQEAGGDIALIKALRACLPPYQGPGLRLWRGETGLNRRHRTYSLSWTADREVARSFAEDNVAWALGGTVVIEADVVSEAIICAPALLGDAYGEGEHLVDRRLLSDVRVIERFPPSAESMAVEADIKERRAAMKAQKQRPS